MRFSRRGFLRLPVGVAALRASARVAMARSYPDRPVRIIVGSPPGGVGDILARLIARWLSVQLDQAFIIENGPGGAGNVGAEAAARAPADGYTLLQISLPPHAIGTELYPRLNFDILHDIAPVASIIRAPTLLEVNPLVPAAAVAEFAPGYEASSWYGFGAPKNTPVDIIDTLNSTINGALADPTMKRKLTELGGDVLPLTPGETGEVIAHETDKWLKVVRFAGIRAE
jgi:tripartite-type tricarboxylate transporter receptor subunit TctC